MEGRRHQRTLAAAFSPGSLPQVWGMRQGAEHNYERPDDLFPAAGVNCQYGNVRAPLGGLADEGKGSSVPSRTSCNMALGAGLCLGLDPSDFFCTAWRCGRQPIKTALARGEPKG